MAGAPDSSATPEPGSRSSLFRYGSPTPVPLPGPAARSSSEERYLAFETDIGGFNNIWMSFEIMALLAWRTGRTLVLPPPKPLYLLGDRPLSLLDFVDRMRLEASVPVLTAREYVERQGLPAKLAQSDAFHAHLRQTAHDPGWNAEKDALIDPPDALTQRLELVPRLLRRRPVALQNETARCDVLYFGSSERYRILGPFETFLLFGDLALERRARRFVRDALRYRQDLLASAERLARSAPLADARYSAMHIRRGDFYRETRAAADAIVHHTEHLFRPGETLYIATDETDDAFLAPFRERYRVTSWRDLAPEATAGVPQEWTGVVEMLLCAAAPGRFAGTRLSTFSARAATIRGYLATTPGGEREGVDAALHYTQPPLRDADDPSADETDQPWWESVRHTPLWGRAYSSVWKAIE